MKMKDACCHAALVLALTTLLAASASAVAQTNDKPTPPPPAADTGFVFGGGSPHAFLNAVEHHYAAKYMKIDWLSIAHIPPEMEEVFVPPLRVSDADESAYINSSEYKKDVPPGSRQRHPRLEVLIALYNRIAREKPELGKLVVEGDLGRPSAVLIVPDKNSVAGKELKVKAFPIGSLPVAQWDGLVHAINEAVKEATVRSSGSARFTGSCRIHGDSRLLLCYGTEAYVELVDSITTAYESNDPKPATPAK